MHEADYGRPPGGVPLLEVIARRSSCSENGRIDDLDTLAPMNEAESPGRDQELLEVRELRISGPLDEAAGTRALLVDSVSFALEPGETLALVGESGSGKTLTALALLGLLPAGVRVEGGSVAFRGVELLRLGTRELQRVRGSGIAMMFQEAASALDPLLGIGRQVCDALRRHGGEERVRERALSLLRELDFDDPEHAFSLRPHELSGGMAQRALLAVTLACDPKVLICDEPTRALDAPTAASVLEILRDARRPHRSQLLISHDLDAVARVAQRIAVMHAGQIVEWLEVGGSPPDLEGRARHPYTRALLAARPGRSPGARLSTLDGEPPRPGAFGSACRFAPRCPHVHARCETEAPGWFGPDGPLPDEPPGGAFRGGAGRWRCFGWDGASGDRVTRCEEIAGV